MPDVASWVAGASAVKSAFDTLKSAIGFLKEAKGLLPEGDQREKAIYELCKCGFPPTPTLTVGELNGRPKKQALFTNAPSADSIRPEHSCTIASHPKEHSPEFSRRAPASGTRLLGLGCGGLLKIHQFLGL